VTILYVIAVEAEYGDHLRARCTPLITGVGPVEAGVAVAAELAHRVARQDLPELVVSLGSAGSNRHAQGSVFQIASVAYRDIDATPLGFPRGRTPFLDLPQQDGRGVLTLPYRIPGVPEASLSTGAAVISGDAAYAAIDADLVDMETYAVLRACQHFDVPLVGLRGVSDGAADLSHYADWAEYLHIVDERLAGAVDTLDAAWRSGSLERR
jgi:adenosylhomocysteine nucleosidase